MPTRRNSRFAPHFPPFFPLSHVQQSIGTCVYAPDQDCIIWTIKQFTGGKEFLMRAHFGLPSVTDGILLLLNSKFAGTFGVQFCFVV
jgi:hypothetical protein